jgi:hypothetical protein
MLDSFGGTARPTLRAKRKGWGAVRAVGRPVAQPGAVAIRPLAIAPAKRGNGAGA